MVVIPSACPPACTSLSWIFIAIPESNCTFIRTESAKYKHPWPRQKLLLHLIRISYYSGNCWNVMFSSVVVFFWSTHQTTQHQCRQTVGLYNVVPGSVCLPIVCFGEIAIRFEITALWSRQTEGQPARTTKEGRERVWAEHVTQTYMHNRTYTTN